MAAWSTSDRVRPRHRSLAAMTNVVRVGIARWGCGGPQNPLLVPVVELKNYHATSQLGSRQGHGVARTNHYSNGTHNGKSLPPHTAATCLNESRESSAENA
jgi:hypothetical protein